MKKGPFKNMFKDINVTPPPKLVDYSMLTNSDPINLGIYYDY